MGLYYTPQPPHIGAQQPLEGKKLTPPSGAAHDNPPFMGGSAVGQAILGCWAAVVVAAAVLPTLPCNLTPPSAPAAVTPVPNTALQNILIAWTPPAPAPIRAINLNPPISGPTPQNPPIRGMRIPLEIQIGWIPLPPLPIVAVNLNPPISGPVPQNPPFMGGAAVPLAVQIAWLPAASAPIVARNLTPLAPVVSYTPVGAQIPQAILASWITPAPAPITGARLNPPISGSVPQNPPFMGGARVPIEVQLSWLPSAPQIYRNNFALPQLAVTTASFSQEAIGSLAIGQLSRVGTPSIFLTGKINSAANLRVQVSTIGVLAGRITGQVKVRAPTIPVAIMSARSNSILAMRTPGGFGLSGRIALQIKARAPGGYALYARMALMSSAMSSIHMEGTTTPDRLPLLLNSGSQYGASYWRGRG